MTQSRQLAAIMFTDIVGYTALMQKDEQAALQALNRFKDVLHQLSSEHEGRIVQYFGDGCLLSFDSPTQGVNCALALQKAFSTNPRVPVRIGMHLGEVVFQNENVFGDGVNIASRVESMGVAGAILMSKSIRDQIKNKAAFQLISLGSFEFKNMEEPMEVYALANEGLPVPKRADLKGKFASHQTPSKSTSRMSWMVATALIALVALVGFLLKDKFLQPSSTDQAKVLPATQRSIAVLPFTNISDDKDQDYFCNGIAEDILNDLAHLKDVRVAARTSSFAYRNQDQDIREIGIKLGVDNIVEGGVQKDGNKLRINVQLINVADGFSLWSAQYNRNLQDIFAVQNEIAQSIVQALKIELNGKEKQDLAKVATRDAQAYDFYIRGRDYFHQAHKDKIQLAIQMFDKAIQKDENYALAFAGLADGYSYTYMFYDSNPENLDQALAASQKALELDPELAATHVARGLALSQNKQFKEAARAFETAIKINPEYYSAYYEYARTTRAQGELSKSLDLFKTAALIEPDNYQSALFLVTAYEDVQLVNEAKRANIRGLEVVKRHIDINPEDSRAMYLYAQSLIRVGKGEEALSWVNKAILLDPDEPALLYNVACIYSLLGEVDEALDYLEQTIALGYASREWIDHDSDLDPIRNLPRFKKILEKMR